MKALCFLWLLVFFSTLGRAADSKISPEKAMGGASNLSEVLRAKIVSIEKVSVPPHIEILGFENGHVKSNEVGINNWKWGIRLTIDKGPIAVPSVEAACINKLLGSPDLVPEIKLGYSYRPSYRMN